MHEVVRELSAILVSLEPSLQPGEAVFCTTEDPSLIARLSSQAIATFREQEGLSLVLERDTAGAAGFDISLPMRCITLKVFSALDGVGLTAAVASALAAEGIACNMISAYHHDHVFVPAEMADRALAILRTSQENARRAVDPA